MARGAGPLEPHEGRLLRARSALLDYLHGVVGQSLGAATDGLTRLYHWAHARRYSDKLLACLRRNGGDHFDRSGEPRSPLKGDRALRSAAKIIGTTPGRWTSPPATRTADSP